MMGRRWIYIFKRFERFWRSVKLRTPAPSQCHSSETMGSIWLGMAMSPKVSIEDGDTLE